ncbi:MAG: dihydrofolate reductase family protein [Anaerolineales bacterium]|nr:dihydrofolate reductase family protein [Anaerolineales bacterium]
MKVSVYIAASIDGYIARLDGDVNWLNEAENSGGQEDYGYKEFSNSVDCMVMGRKSYEMVLSFLVWPYEGKRVIVLSKSLKDIPEESIGKIELYSGEPKQLVNKLKDKGCKHLYIDGGKKIQSFLKEDLITDITITKIPILLGEGIPLFGKTGRDIKLKHVKTKTYKNGFIQSTYDI